MATDGQGNATLPPGWRYAARLLFSRPEFEKHFDCGAKDDVCRRVHFDLTTSDVWHSFENQFLEHDEKIISIQRTWLTKFLTNEAQMLVVAWNADTAPFKAYKDEAFIVTKNGTRQPALIMSMKLDASKMRDRDARDRVGDLLELIQQAVWFTPNYLLMNLLLFLQELA